MDFAILSNKFANLNKFVNVVTKSPVTESCNWLICNSVLFKLMQLYNRHDPLKAHIQWTSEQSLKMCSICNNVQCLRSCLTQDGGANFRSHCNRNIHFCPFVFLSYCLSFLLSLCLFVFLSIQWTSDESLRTVQSLQFRCVFVFLSFCLSVLSMNKWWESENSAIWPIPMCSLVHSWRTLFCLYKYLNKRHFNRFCYRKHTYMEHIKRGVKTSE